MSMKTTLRARTAPGALAATLLALPATAETIHVDLNANCTIGDGTAASPYCSLVQAVTAAASGDTIVVAEGLYPGEVVLSRDITIRGVGDVVLRGEPAQVTVTVQPGVTAILEDLDITGARRSGVRNWGSLTLRRCEVRNNFQNNVFAIVPRRAVGIDNDVPTGPLVVEGCLVAENTELPNLGYFQAVGGLWSRGTQPVVILDSEFRDNSGTSGGTLICDSPLRIEGSTFDEQPGVQPGMQPGVRLNGPSRVTSSTFGAGLSLMVVNPPPGATTEFEGCTFGPVLIGLSPASTGQVHLANSILAGLAGTPGADGTFVSAGFNLVTNGDLATGFGPDDLVGSTAAPLPAGLDALADNGGPTRTMALLPGSPAIAAASTTSFATVDQRGRLRIAGTADIGAFQTASPSVGFHTPSCPGTVNGGGRIARTAALGSLAVAANAMAIAAVDVTPNQFGIFLVSRTSGFLPVGGSNLCLTGTIGRFVGPGEIQNSGPQGRLSIPIDLTSLPQGSTLDAAAPGETWVFQAWFRDTIGESSFAVATQVTFQ